MKLYFIHFLSVPLISSFYLFISKFYTTRYIFTFSCYPHKTECLYCYKISIVPFYKDTILANHKYYISSGLGKGLFAFCIVRRWWDIKNDFSWMKSIFEWSGRKHLWLENKIELFKYKSTNQPNKLLANWYIEKGVAWIMNSNTNFPSVMYSP